MGAHFLYIILFIFTLFAVYFAQDTQATSDDNTNFYTAGVVEFHTSRASNTKTRLEENLKAFIDIIISEEAKPTDILVFPESVLNSQIEFTYVNEHEAPCDDRDGFYHDFLIQLSCQARNVSKYIVINLSERSACDATDPRPCSGFNKFNTNIVFDRKGFVVSRYRKVNLWGENGTNVTYIPDVSFFDTDFGVRFGHFICFDLLFYTPGQKMVDELGITNFLVTARWFSQIPFLTANQIQFAWSYGNDVTLLAAGASDPDYGSSGSGIYTGRDGWANIFVQKTGAGVRKLIVAQVPKKRTRVQIHATMKHSFFNITTKQGEISVPINLKRDPVELYTTVLVNLTNGNSIKRELCTNELFCCDFLLKWKNLNTSENNHYYYRLAVFNGIRKEVAPTTNYLKNCAVISCLSEDIMDCGKYFDGEKNMDLSSVTPQVAFERIEISANFSKTIHHVIMPSTLKSNILPIPVNQFEWIEEDTTNYQNIRMILNTTTDDLLTFSLYGNYYDYKTSEASLPNSVSSFYFITCLISVTYAL